MGEIRQTHPLTIWRLERGLTQRQVADQTGVSHSAVCRAEQWRRIHPATVAMLCRKTGLSPAVFRQQKGA